MSSVMEDASVCLGCISITLDIWHTNLVITMPADFLALNDAGPLAGTTMTGILHMDPSLILKLMTILKMCQMLSWKLANKILWNVTEIHVLISD